MLNFAVDNEVFDVEEKLVLNHVAVGVSQSVCCEQILFDMEIVDNDTLSSALQSLYAKVRDLTEDEWNSLQSFLPFEVPLSDDDISADLETLDM